MTAQTHNWKLDHPLAVFDIEATGTSPRADRIVEIAVIKMEPDGTRSTHTSRVNPGIKIPAEATRVHGITDADVAACPSFPDIAPGLFELLQGCDLAGYNLLRYDIPMLVEEFLRAGIDFRAEGRRVVDAQRIFHRREPRDLSAALLFYCDASHSDAHGAEADAAATLRVLEGQLKTYPDLPHDIGQLDLYCNPRAPDWADRTGRLRWVNGQVVLNFGKRKGEPLKDIIERDPNYIKWMLTSDFPRDTQEIVRAATEGTWPTPPESTTE